MSITSSGILEIVKVVFIKEGEALPCSEGPPMSLNTVIFASSLAPDVKMRAAAKPLFRRAPFKKGGRRQSSIMSLAAMFSSTYKPQRPITFQNRSNWLPIRTESA